MKALIVALSILLFAWSANAQDQPCTGSPLNPGANVAAAISSAAAGSVICLNSGSYGAVSIASVQKSSKVTVRSVSGTSASLSLDIFSSRQLAFDRLTITSIYLHDNGSAPSRDLSFTNGLITGQAYLDMAGNGNANILIYGMTVSGYDSTGPEGSIHIEDINGPAMTGPAGIRIEFSTFDGGFGSADRSCSDGIEANVVGVTVGPGNIFRNWRTPCNGVHSDAIQILGSGCLTVEGNYFEDNSVHLGYYDGGASGCSIVRNNIFNGGGLDATGGNHQAFQIGGINGMTFSHNTIVNIPTSGIGTKTGLAHNTNWIIENNILVNSSIQAAGDQPGCGANCIVRYNQRDASSSLLTGATNTNNTVASTTWVGGSSPTTWAGWRLCATTDAGSPCNGVASPGRLGGNDGKDLGNLFRNINPGVGPN